MAAGFPTENLYFQNLPHDMNDESLSQIFAAIGYTVLQAKVMPNQVGDSTCVALVRFASVDDAKFVLENFNGTALPGFEKPLNISYANKPGGSQYAPGSGPAAMAAALQMAAAANMAGGGGYAGGGGGGGYAGGGGGGGCAGGGYARGGYGKGGGYGKAPVSKPAAMLGGMQGGAQPYVKSRPDASDNLYIKGLPATADETFVQALFGQYGQVRMTKVLRKGENVNCHALVRFSSAEEAANIITQLNGGMLEGFTTPLEINYAYDKSMASFGSAGLLGGGPPATGDPETEQMLDEWVKAKRTRDYATADSLRATLRAKGIDPDHARP